MKYTKKIKTKINNTKKKHKYKTKKTKRNNKTKYTHKAGGLKKAIYISNIDWKSLYFDETYLGLSKNIIGDNKSSELYNTNEPIENYFIFSSHNTELLRAQSGYTIFSNKIYNYIGNNVISQFIRRNGITSGGCLELDISGYIKDKENNIIDAKVSHAIGDNYLSFNELFKSICDYYNNDENKNNLPLIINIDVDQLCRYFHKQEDRKLHSKHIYNLIENIFQQSNEKYKSLFLVNDLFSENENSQSFNKGQILDDLKGKILIRGTKANSSTNSSNLNSLSTNNLSTSSSSANSSSTSSLSTNNLSTSSSSTNNLSTSSSSTNSSSTNSSSTSSSNTSSSLTLNNSSYLSSSSNTNSLLKSNNSSKSNNSLKTNNLQSLILPSIDKQKYSSTISINDKKPKYKDYQIKDKESLKNKLSRTYPNTIRSIYTYDFSNLIKSGYNLISLNLQIFDINTLAYLMFFYSSHYILKKNIINTLIISNHSSYIVELNILLPYTITNIKYYNYFSKDFSYYTDLKDLNIYVLTFSYNKKNYFTVFKLTTNKTQKINIYAYQKSSKYLNYNTIEYIKTDRIKIYLNIKIIGNTKIADACWFNPKSEPKCYRFKQKDEA